MKSVGLHSCGTPLTCHAFAVYVVSYSAQLFHRGGTTIAAGRMALAGVFCAPMSAFSPAKQKNVRLLSGRRHGRFGDRVEDHPAGSSTHGFGLSLSPARTPRYQQIDAAIAEDRRRVARREWPTNSFVAGLRVRARPKTQAAIVWQFAAEVGVEGPRVSPLLRRLWRRRLSHDPAVWLESCVCVCACGP